jgi:hypothetical protein
LALVGLGACAYDRIPEAPDSPSVAVELPEDRQARQLARVQSAGRLIVERYRAEQAGEELGDDRAVVEAIRTARNLPVERCAETYRALPVVGDAVGGPGEGLIAVYLVPEPANPRIVPIGGFHRITVDAESGNVVHRAALSSGCRDLSLYPDERDDGARVTSLLVNHVLTDYPLESHVFASMVYDVDLVVLTPTTTWQIAGGRVRALD